MTNKHPDQIKKNSYIIGGCILISRILGLLREILLARLLGTTIYSDALRAAIRIPNFLQNLFGEGVLSASFIPTYSRLRGGGKNLEASTTAKEIGKLLLWLTLSLSILGVILSNALVEIFAGGFSQKTKELTRTLIVLMFPATGFLVLSAWCLGILNSHRYFSLSYSAPIIWNLTIILGLIFYSNGKSLADTALLTAQLFLIGSLMQFLIQVPKTFSLIRNQKSKVNLFSLQTSAPTKEVIKTFPPVFLGRGLIQISAYLDTIISSFLAPGSLSSLMYAQTLYLTPISVFGLSNAAASLPEMAEQDPKKASLEVKTKIEAELRKTLRRILSYCTLTIVVFIILGQLLIKLVFEHGNFDQHASSIVYATLLSFLPGLIPSTWGRVITSLLYASGEQRSVVRISFIRLITSTIFTFALCFLLLPKLELAEEYFVCGIGIASSISSFIEIFLLNRLATQTTKISPIRVIFG